jgi:hypothetical protein
MTSSEIMKLARHWDWDKAKMQTNWLEANENKRRSIRHQLGIDFDKTLDDYYPDMKLSHRDAN